MEDGYNTMPLDDTVALDSPFSESRLLNLDMDTEVLNAREFAQHSGDQMEDNYCQEEVVLDSDDEGGDKNEAIDLMNGCFSRIGRLAGMDEICLRKRQKIHAGYFRRVDKKVREHVFLHTDSTRSGRCDEESNAGRASLYSGSRFREHLGVMDSVLSTSPDQKSIPTNAKEFLVDPDYQNILTECLVEDSLDERKLSSHDSKSINTGKNAEYDCDRAQLNYDESPEAAESHNEALGFVDHYLSSNDLGLYKNIETRKTNRITSPPSLRSKGSQCLARRIDLAHNASKSVAFDWTEKHIEKDEYTSLRMNDDPIFGLEGEKSEHVSSNRGSDNVNLQNGISNLHSKEKLPGNIFSTKDLDSNSLNSNDIDKIGSNSGTFTAYDSIELEKQFDAGLSRQNVEECEKLRLTPEALDIGLDTQIAAEAMEELLHAAPPMFDPCLIHQCSDSTFLNSSNTVNKKTKQENVVNYKEAFVGWKRKEKRSRCMKISTIQDKNAYCFAAKRFENRRKTVAQLSVNKKLMAAEALNSRNPGNSSDSKWRALTGITVQQEEYGLTERDSLIESQRLHCLYGRSSKDTTDGLKFPSPPKRRKMISFRDDLSKIGVRDSSFKVKTDTSEGEENNNLNVADRTLSKLNPWVYPKRKRSRSCTVRHPIKSSNQCSPRAEIENNVEKYPKVNNEPYKRVANLLVYKRRRRISLQREHIERSLELDGNLSPSVNHNAASENKVQNSFEFDTANPSMQCGKFDERKLSSVDASNNMKSGVLLSNGHPSTLQVFESSEKSKKPFKQLSRSPLMKELSRLGYTELLPDFLPKDSRRRRAMEKVCILFSKNLETSVLKQQRKIVARLGFSVTSCFSDATHFVTDRFVRTRNMLEAIALGKHVVTHFWLESCEQAGYVIDEKSYILRDEKKEKEIGFNMLVSLTRASQHPLLKGCKVLITPNAKPGVDAINSLVKAVGGRVVQNIQNPENDDKLVADDLLILSCEEDYTICLPFLEKGASIYDSELLLNGIVTQKLENERYKLFKDFAKNGPSFVSRRRNGNIACATHP